MPSAISMQFPCTSLCLGPQAEPSELSFWLHTATSAATYGECGGLATIVRKARPATARKNARVKKVVAVGSRIALRPMSRGSTQFEGVKIMLLTWFGDGTRGARSLMMLHEISLEASEVRKT